MKHCLTGGDHIYCCKSNWTAFCKYISFIDGAKFFNRFPLINHMNQCFNMRWVNFAIEINIINDLLIKY